MLSLSVHANLTPLAPASTSPTSSLLHHLLLLPPKPLSFSSSRPNSTLHKTHHLPLKKLPSFSSSASSAAVEALETSPDVTSDDQEEEKQKLRVVVKAMEKPRIVLKFIWMERNIGLALDQVIPGHGSIPLSPYYFWPRKDAWEELKSKLEEKPWISQKRMIILLNQATDIINLWQQSGGNL
ncbi:small ribosomal subunit protein cS23 [Typha angustifolia]|uniref:small ribosomal subunit protein cS23 n=1 Tax=Typha angustifolia TaxID=59011 RepID=UPI003C2CC7AE